ncbi:MAG: hypothetical protein AWT59_1459 [Candidatus Gallionella acididurans]|uniref:Uncharacterized protein n=1 Tax=Candidatus Gallionella acididurans TaxID=1796491 RepID=A0A139BTX5_9PROT|nr:MAG: hypothetical protein AWT59_1459 [Candidatus Gallionella acididurans]
MPESGPFETPGVAAGRQIWLIEAARRSDRLRAGPDQLREHGFLRLGRKSHTLNFVIELRVTRIFPLVEKMHVKRLEEPPLRVFMLQPEDISTSAVAKLISVSISKCKLLSTLGHQ